MALQTITVRVAANTAGVSQAFATAEVDIKNFEKSFSGMSTRVAAMGEFLGNVFYKVASTIGSALMKVGSDALKYSKEYNDAIVGLTSVARAYSGSSDAALAAAKSLAADGLLPLGSAAKGLKNLLQTGFGVKEATDIMTAFKDAAVYARQGNYSYADSITTATEGIKNFQSRLVDNVGITKNLSVILKEAGVKITDLGVESKKTTVLQAIHNGIMREAAAQAGDAARSLNTYSGAMTALQSSYRSSVAEIGNFITRSESVMILLKTVAEWMRQLTERLVANRQGFNLVSDAIILTVKALSSLLQIADYVQTAYNGLRITFDNFSIAMVKMAVKILEVSEKFSTLAKYTDPLNAKMHADEARQARDAITYLNGAMEGFKKDAVEAERNSIKWGNAIQEVKAQVDALGVQLEKSRGNMIDLGKASREAGDRINQVGGTAEKMSKEVAAAWKKAEAAIKRVQDDLRLGIQGTIGLRYDIAGSLKDVLIPHEIEKTIQELADKMKLGIQGAGPGLKIDIRNTAKQLVKEIYSTGQVLRRAWAEIMDDLPKTISNAFSQHANVFAAVGKLVADKFGDAYRKALERQAKNPDLPVTNTEKLLGKISAYTNAAFTGYDIGSSTASKTKGVLGGAATGFMYGGPAGAAIGGIFGFIGASNAQKKAKQEELASLRDAKQALLDQVGGYDKLKKAADAAGVSFSAIYNATSLKSFNAEVAKLNKGLTDQKAHLEALGTAMDAINKRAELFAAPFRALIETIQKAKAEGASEADQAAGSAAADKLLETAQRSQGAFERLGVFIKDAFAGVVREGGSAIDALTQMAPAFQVLQDGVTQFGLTSTPVIEELLASFQLVNDEGMKPLFEQIAATGALLKALFDAKALSPEGFQAAAADIGASLQGIIDKGGDVSKTLALSQPVLQTLWEAQQKFGAITDDTTASLLQQAEEQGLVGEQMKAVNEKILDVLLAIGDVLGAKLPDYFSKLKGPAQDAADGIETAFTGIHIPPIDVKVRPTLEDLQYEVPEFGSGGIVRRPTLAIVGERGPEAIVPLTGSQLGVGGSYTTDIYLDGDRIARSTAKRLPGVLRGYGV